MDSQQTPDTSDPDKWFKETVNFRILNASELKNIINDTEKKSLWPWVQYRIYTDPSSMITTTLFFIITKEGDLYGYATNEDVVSYLKMVYSNE